MKKQPLNDYDKYYKRLFFYYFLQLYVKAEVHYITILHDVIFSF